MSGNAARLSRGLKWRLTMFWASRGLPLLEANTRSFSCHFAPALTDLRILSGGRQVGQSQSTCDRQSLGEYLSVKVDLIWLGGGIHPVNVSPYSPT
jgi:hypothetical protein